MKLFKNKIKITVIMLLVMSFTLSNNLSYASNISNFTMRLSNSAGVTATYNNSSKILTIKGSGKIEYSNWVNMAKKFDSNNFNENGWVGKENLEIKFISSKSNSIKLPNTGQKGGLFQNFDGRIIFNNVVNTSEVTNMSKMFSGAVNFNSPINFDTKNVTDMREMFLGAKSFNQDVNFDTSKVENMSNMFNSASSFNKKINFNMSKVKNASWMLYNATNYRQDINFNLENILEMRNIFSRTAIKNIDITKVGNKDRSIYVKSPFGESNLFSNTKPNSIKFKFLERFIWKLPLSYKITNVTDNDIKTVLAGENYKFKERKQYKLEKIKSLLRVEGKSRYATSVEASKFAYDNAYSVILASGENYPDALVAGPLGKVLKAPVLLTPKKEMTMDVFNEIKRLKADKVYIIGSELAISKNVESKLKSRGLIVQRIEGKSRYETSEKVVKFIEKINGKSKNMIVVRGDNFPDAIVAGPYSVKYNTPIILTNKNIILNTTKKYFDNHNRFNKITLIGSELAISNHVKNKLSKYTNNISRISGKTRYETSIKVAKFLESDMGTAIIAVGTNFPDALVSSNLINSGIYFGPIILTPKNELNIDVRNFIQNNKKNINLTLVMGSNKALSDKVKQEVQEILR